MSFLFSVIALLLGLAVIAAVGISLRAGRNSVTEAVGALWTNRGVEVAIIGVISFVLGILAVTIDPTPLAAIGATIGGCAAAAGVGIVLHFDAAVRKAGGRIRWARAARPTPLSVPAPDHTATYTSAEGTPRRILLWTPGSKSTNAHAPVLFFVHGGGWMEGNGDAQSNAADMRWFAERGWLAVSIDYALSTSDHPSWESSTADVALALRWVAANAARFGGDPAALVAKGVSAGGNLALNVAYGAASGQMPGLPTPVAVIAYVPAVDPGYTAAHGVAFRGFKPFDFISDYIGGPPADYPDRVAAISTSSFISKCAPPTLIIEPKNDGFVPSEAVISFVDKAIDAGIDVRLVRLPLVNHFAVTSSSLANQAILTIIENYCRGRGIAPPLGNEGKR